MRGRRVLGLLGAGLVAGWLVVAGVSPSLVPYSPRQVDVMARLKPPSAGHVFGTDALGRDVFSRVLVGSRVSLPSGFTVVLVAAVVGTLYGGCAAYGSARVEEGLMRVTDLFLSFPPLVLAMAIAAALGVGVRNTVLAMFVVWWPKYARLARGLVLGQRSLDYVEAARGLGLGGARTLLRHIVPNTVGPIVVLLALDVGNAMITFAGPLVPRPGRGAADPGVGRHGLRRPGADRPVVGVDLSGTGDLLGGGRLQLHGRLAARLAGPSPGALTRSPFRGRPRRVGVYSPQEPTACSG